ERVGQARAVFADFVFAELGDGVGIVAAFERPSGEALRGFVRETLIGTEHERGSERFVRRFQKTPYAGAGNFHCAAAACRACAMRSANSARKRSAMVSAARSRASSCAVISPKAAVEMS